MLQLDHSKIGAASLAIKNNKPILPMAYSYRKAGWLRQKLFKQTALFNLNIGEPVFANPDLDKTAQIEDLTRRAHQSVCYLAGFEGNDIYEPIYHNSKRIDY